VLLLHHKVRLKKIANFKLAPHYATPALEALSLPLNWMMGTLGLRTMDVLPEFPYVPHEKWLPSGNLLHSY